MVRVSFLKEDAQVLILGTCNYLKAGGNYFIYLFMTFYHGVGAILLHSHNYSISLPDWRYICVLFVTSLYWHAVSLTVMCLYVFYIFLFICSCVQHFFPKQFSFGTFKLILSCLINSHISSLTFQSSAKSYKRALIIKSVPKFKPENLKLLFSLCIFSLLSQINNRCLI